MLNILSNNFPIYLIPYIIYNKLISVLIMRHVYVDLNTTSTKFCCECKYQHGFNKLTFFFQ